ncbi:MAG: hypothetical protein ACHBNF_09425 [Chromatiales bacterium]
MKPKPDDLDVEQFSRVVDEKRVTLGGTVDMFWAEVDQFRRQDHGNRLFTDPQCFVFQWVRA